MINDISQLDFVAFDTETTGLSPQSEGLVEIAAVRFDLKLGAREYFQTLVNPGKSIPYEVSRIHGITDEMVFESPSIDKVLPSFFQFIEGAIPVAHNAPFDIGFVSMHALRAGITPPTMPILDSCRFSRRIFTDVPSHKLENLARHFEIQSSTFHRALADAKTCMEVFMRTVRESCGIEANWESLVEAHGKIHYFADQIQPQVDQSKVMSPIFDALEKSKSLWIIYETNYSPREITPHLLYKKGALTYLEATCHLDGVRKNFRVDRIKKIVPLEQGASV